jgi:hypothetical protein
MLRFSRSGRDWAYNLRVPKKNKMIQTPVLFQTVDEAYAACEAAGLEPIRGFDYPDGEKFSVSFNGSRFTTYYSEAQFLGFANSYFIR